MCHKQTQNNNMPAEITYRPNKPVCYFLVGIAIGSILYIWLAWTADTLHERIEWLGIVLINFALILYAYPCTRLIVKVDQNKIIRCNAKTKETFQADWTQFSTAYYMTFPHRAGSWLLLTPLPIDDLATRKKISAHIRKVGRNAPVLSYNGCTCLDMTDPQRCQAFLTMIGDKIPIIKNPADRIT